MAEEDRNMIVWAQRIRNNSSVEEEVQAFQAQNQETFVEEAQGKVNQSKENTCRADRSMEAQEINTKKSGGIDEVVLEVQRQGVVQIQGKEDMEALTQGNGTEVSKFEAQSRGIQAQDPNLMDQKSINKSGNESINDLEGSHHSSTAEPFIPIPQTRKSQKKGKKKKKMRKIPIATDEYWADIETDAEEIRSRESRASRTSKKRLHRSRSKRRRARSEGSEKGRVLESGDFSNSISNSHIAHHIMADHFKPNKGDADRIWELGKLLGVKANGAEQQVVSKLRDLNQKTGRH